MAHVDVAAADLGAAGGLAAAPAGRRLAGRRPGAGRDRGVARLRRPVLGPVAALQLPRHRRPGGDRIRCAGVDTLAWPRPLDVDGDGRRRPRRCWASTTSPRSAAAARAPRRSGPCSASRSTRTGALVEWHGAGRRVLLLDGPLARRGAARASVTAGVIRDWPAAKLALRVRADDVAVAPPHGLTLVEVGYPPDAELAARAAAHPAASGWSGAAASGAADLTLSDGPVVVIAAFGRGDVTRAAVGRPARRQRRRRPAAGPAPQGRGSVGRVGQGEGDLPRS